VAKARTYKKTLSLNETVEKAVEELRADNAEKELLVLREKLTLLQNK